MRRQLAVAEFEDAVHFAGEVGGVGDDDEGDVLLAVEVEEEGGEGVGVVAVEGAGGFVGEEKFGAVDERADDGDALAFAAGELAGAVVEAVGETDVGEERLGASTGGAAAAGVGIGEGGDEDVFQHGALGQEMVRLKDEADLLVADARELEVVEAPEVFAVEEELAGGGAVEGADDVEERAFAAAGRADDGNAFAAREVERDALEHIDALGPGSGGVLFGDVLELQERRGRWWR